MALLNLTDRKLQTLKTEKPQEDFWDNNLGGFGVRVSRGGRKSFVLMYHFEGRKRRTTLGRYPALSLADARDKAKVMLFDIARGTDPQAKKQQERKAMTFGALATEYLERHARLKKRSWKEDERILRHDLLPEWGRRRAKSIKRRDAIDLLDKIVERGSPIMANRTRALISKIYNFGIGRDEVEHNPCTGVPVPGKEKQRDRVLTAEEIQQFWHACSQLEFVMGATFKMRLLTAQRGIEVLSMRWSDISDGWWTIPAEVSKNELAHGVPLSPQAMALLQDLQTANEGSDWVFPSPKIPGSPITAVGKAAKKLVDVSGINFVPHDLRRTAASYMTSMGISRLVVSKILNHVEQGVTAVYDRHSYDTEKREALDLWGGRIDEILQVSTDEAGDVRGRSVSHRDWSSTQTKQAEAPAVSSVV